MDIARFLADDEYNAAVGANAPSASNVYATIADLSGGGGIYGGSGSLSGATIVTMGVNDLTFAGAGQRVILGTTTNLQIGGVAGNVIRNLAGNIRIEATALGANLELEAVAGVVIDGTLSAALRSGSDGLEVNNLVHTFTDNSNLKGIEYAGDYSANFTNESLITKRYVDNAVIADTSIYANDGALAANRTVSLAGNDLSFNNAGFGDLLYLDATNNRIGIGTNTPLYVYHQTTGDMYVQSGNFAIGSSTPVAGIKMRATITDADGANAVILRADMSNPTATGNHLGLNVRSTAARSGATSFVRGIDSNLTGSVTAGVHDIVAGRFRVATTVSGGTLNKYALELVDGTEGTAGHVWASVTTTGLGHWVDPNTLITAGSGGIYTGSGSLSGATTVTNATFNLDIAGTASTTRFTANGEVLIGGTTLPLNQGELLVVETSADEYGWMHKGGTTVIASYVDASAGWLGMESAHDFHLYGYNGGSYGAYINYTEHATDLYWGVNHMSPTATWHIKGQGDTSADAGLLVENSSGNDVLKANGNQTVIIGEYVGAKGSRTTLLVNGNASNTQTGAIGLHVKANVDNGPNSDIVLIEHANPAGGSPNLTSSLLRVMGGHNAFTTPAKIGLKVSSHPYVSIGRDTENLVQLSVASVWSDDPTPPNGTTTAHFRNETSVTSLTAVDKYGVKITSTGTFVDTDGPDAKNVGLEVTVGGANLNYAAIFTGGRVGLGTSAPTADLHINSTVANDNLRLVKSNSTTSWLLNAGRAAFFDNWLLFKNSGEAGNYTFAVTNTGVMRGKDGSAGAPTYAFDNGSNYGMSLTAANDGTVISAAGFPLLTVLGTATKRVEIRQDAMFRLKGMSTTTRDTLTPLDGDVIHNTTLNKLQVRLNGAWETITSA